MICHDAPGKNFQTFVLLAESETLQQYIFVFISGKYINPFNNSETNKIDSFRVMEFLITTHLKKLAKNYYHAKGFPPPAEKEVRAAAGVTGIKIIRFAKPFLERNCLGMKIRIFEETKLYFLLASKQKKTA